MKKKTTALPVLAVTALLPLMEAKANSGIPAECLIPSKVMPKVCQELPAEVCLDWFKARIQNHTLGTTTGDKTAEAEARFCLRQFTEQLYSTAE